MYGEHHVDGEPSRTNDVCAMLASSTSVDEKMSDQVLYDVTLAENVKDNGMTNGGRSECDRQKWKPEDDNFLRHLAKKMSWKEFGLLKACTEVLEKYDGWFKETPMKIPLKETIKWPKENTQFGRQRM